jgi:hypothetical protein
MAEPTQNERSKDAAGLAAAARDRGMEQLEGAKGQLAEGAERVAAAVERTADELDGDGDGALSGFGHSVASLMRQLAGGLRERDVDDFARELAALARRNPGVFLAGSVALGFGIARFFKARAPHAAERRDYGSWQEAARGRGDWQESGDWRSKSERNSREDFDGDDSLDLSSSTRRDDGEGARTASGSSSSQEAENRDASMDAAGRSSNESATAQALEADDRGQGTTRSAGKESKRGGKS